MIKKKRLLKRRKTIGERIDEVVIPGTTGGLYTIWSGTLLLLLSGGAALYGLIQGKEVPSIFDQLVYGGLGLMGVHAGRSVFANRNAGNVAERAVEGIDIGEGVSITTNEDGDIYAKKVPSNEVPPTPAPKLPNDDLFQRQKEAVKG